MFIFLPSFFLYFILQITPGLVLDELSMKKIFHLVSVHSSGFSSDLEDFSVTCLVSLTGLHQISSDTYCYMHRFDS